MVSRLTAQATHARRGFTLVEVTVAMGIMAALIAIAIATFGGVNDERARTQAETSLERMFTAQRAYYGSFGVYAASSGSDPDQLERLPEGLTLVASPTPSTDTATISAALASGGEELGMAVRAPNELCFYLHATADGAFEITASTATAVSCDGADTPEL